MVLITFDYFATQVFADPQFVNRSTALYYVIYISIQTTVLVYLGKRVAFFLLWCAGVFLNSLGLLGLWMCPASASFLSALCVLSMGCGNGFLSTSLNGLVGSTSSTAVNAMMVGQGVGGVFCAGLSLLNLTFVTVGAVHLLATFVMLATLPLYWFSFRLIPCVLSAERQKAESMQMSAAGNGGPAGAELHRSRA